MWVLIAGAQGSQPGAQADAGGAPREEARQAGGRGRRGRGANGGRLLSRPAQQARAPLQSARQR